MNRSNSFGIYFKIIPFILLIGFSSYLGYTSWQNYSKNIEVKSFVTNSILLQDLEISSLNELLCNSKVNHNKKCSELKVRTDKLIGKVKSLNIEVDNLINRSLLFKNTFTKDNISDLSNIIKDKKDKKIVSDVSKYILRLNNFIDTSKENEIIKLYSKLLNIVYATELEKIFVKIYISNKKPISFKDYIFWDNVIVASNLDNLELGRYNSYDKKLLTILSVNEDFQKVLKEISNIRVDRLYAKSSQKYNNGNAQWIVLLNEKQNILKKMQTIISKKIDTIFTNKKNYNLVEIVISIFGILVAFISLIYLFIAQKEQEEHKRRLYYIEDYVSNLALYREEDKLFLEEIHNKIKDDKEIYSYIKESFDLLERRAREYYEESLLKSEFLSTLSSELNTPLNGIIGYSKLLRDIGISADKDEFLSVIEKSSYNLITIVNDILDLANMKSKNIYLENSSFELTNIIEVTISSIILQAEQKDIELSLFIDPSINQNVLGDKNKLSQLLVIIIDNSIRLTKDYGKIDISIKSLESSKDKLTIKFEIEDNGLGLSQEEQKNIFNENSKYNLALANKIVALMGGKLELISQKGNGARYFFTITFEKDLSIKAIDRLSFKNINVGLAIPIKSIRRRVDRNLEKYMKYLGVNFTICYYDDIFADNSSIVLPDIMIFDHHYARLSGELEQCSSLDCETILLTNATLHSRISLSKHNFSDIILMPITLKKCVRILNNLNNDKKNNLLNKYINRYTQIKKLNILLVDDNSSNIKMMKSIFERVNFNVVTAKSGKEALYTYNGSSKFDIIFMDIYMPIMDGISATKHILKYEKENNIKHVPIIGLCRNDSKENREKYIAEGLDECVKKPLDLEIVKEIVEKFT